jgi:alanine racemase
MRATRAEIDLAAICHNIRQIQSVIKPTTTITAVVKANAYGHGVIPVSHAALSAGADCLAVAIPEEGAELREAGFTVPILILGLTLPEQAETIVHHELTATVCTAAQLFALAQAAKSCNKQARIMVKVDTGMNRVGLPPDQLLAFIRQIQAYPQLLLRGVFTHLATADAADKEYAYRQLNTFEQALQQVSLANITLPFISAGNSAAVIDLPDSQFTTVRPGIILYGLPPSHEMHRQLNLLPAMSLHTKVVHVKEVLPGTAVSYGCTYCCPEKTWLATLPIGYADGYHRALSNKASVLIGGKRRPLVGRVCMDQIVVDIGPVCDVAVGDDVVLFGRQGNEEITVTELADLADTINYELVCAVSSRVPRVYKNQ